MYICIFVWTPEVTHLRTTSFAIGLVSEIHQATIASFIESLMMLLLVFLTDRVHSIWSLLAIDAHCYTAIRTFLWWTPSMRAVCLIVVWILELTTVVRSACLIANCAFDLELFTFVRDWMRLERMSTQATSFADTLLTNDKWRVISNWTQDTLFMPIDLST